MNKTFLFLITSLYTSHIISSENPNKKNRKDFNQKGSNDIASEKGIEGNDNELIKESTTNLKWQLNEAASLNIMDEIKIFTKDSKKIIFNYLIGKNNIIDNEIANEVYSIIVQCANDLKDILLDKNQITSNNKRLNICLNIVEAVFIIECTNSNKLEINKDSNPLLSVYYSTMKSIYQKLSKEQVQEITNIIKKRYYKSLLLKNKLVLFIS